MITSTYHPSIWSKSARIAFRKFMEPSDTVDIEGLYKRIRRAHKLSISHEDSKILAVGAVKSPHESYVQRLSELFSYEISSNMELGWIYVDQACRGKGLADLIIKQSLIGLEDFRMYATVSVYNKPMIHLLTKNGFTQVSGFYSNKKRNLISLMIKDGIIAKEIM